jgi:hypothetical protein
VHLTAAIEQKMQRTVSHVDRSRTFSLLSNCSERNAVCGGYGLVCGKELK